MNNRNRMNIKKDIGTKIKVLRAKHSINQTELAKGLGTTQRSISKWETGKNMIDLESLLAICRIFDISLSHFDPKEEP